MPGFTPPARQQAITAALGSVLTGDELAGQLRRHPDGLTPEDLAETLITGLAAGEFRSGRGAVYQLLGTSEFLLRPLPDLVFLRDPSVWISDQVAVASPAAASRRVAAELIGIIYARHPLFAGTKTLYRPGQEPLHGGDLLLAAPGVIAAGCPPPGVARLERCGIESITVPGNELCGARGGPRSLCCPVSRDPAPLPAGLRTEL